VFRSGTFLFSFVGLWFARLGEPQAHEHNLGLSLAAHVQLLADRFFARWAKKRSARKRESTMLPQANRHVMGRPRHAALLNL